MTLNWQGVELDHDAIEIILRQRVGHTFIVRLPQPFEPMPFVLDMDTLVRRNVELTKKYTKAITITPELKNYVQSSPEVARHYALFYTNQDTDVR